MSFLGKSYANLCDQWHVSLNNEPLILVFLFIGVFEKGLYALALQLLRLQTATMSSCELPVLTTLFPKGDIPSKDNSFISLQTINNACSLLRN